MVASFCFSRFPTADRIDRRNPMHEAACRGDFDTLAACLAAGGDANVRSEDETTPLHFAAAQGNADAVRALLAAGAEAASLDVLRETPLHKAARYGKAECMQLLLAAGASPNAENARKVRCERWAAWRGADNSGDWAARTAAGGGDRRTGRGSSHSAGRGC
jgi:ankyrin repeat protein